MEGRFSTPGPGLGSDEIGAACGEGEAGLAYIVVVQRDRGAQAALAVAAMSEAATRRA